MGEIVVCIGCISGCRKEQNRRIRAVAKLYQNHNEQSNF